MAAAGESHQRVGGIATILCFRAAKVPSCSRMNVNRTTVELQQLPTTCADLPPRTAIAVSHDTGVAADTGGRMAACLLPTSHALHAHPQPHTRRGVPRQ